MKKVFIFCAFILLLSSCAEEKTFKVDNTNYIKAEPYGWANSDAKKIDGVVYQVSAGNIFWSIIFSETIVIPIYLTGWQLFEPVRLKNAH